MILSLFIAALVFYAYAASRGLRKSVSGEPHAFRQSQTGLGIWSIVKHGRHELPALGPGGADGRDWRIPFEFPLYQWTAAVLVKATKVKGWGSRPSL